jgi:lysozyme
VKIHNFYIITLVLAVLMCVAIGTLLVTEIIFDENSFKEDSVVRSDSIVSTSVVDTTHTEVSSNWAKGIDISKYQGVINWDSLAPKISFAICKATEGRTLVDTDFSRNWSDIKQSGRIRGAYHFYISSDDPISQAEFFWSRLSSDYTNTDLPLVLDVETASLRGNISKETLEGDVLTFLQKLQDLSGRVPMVYSNTYFANHYLTSTDFSKYPLWVAEYTSNESPNVPKAWASKGWNFWQKTDTYNVTDINGEVDFDRYNGSFSSLHQFNVGTQKK